MAKNTGLLIASTNLWAGITFLLSLSPVDAGTTNFTSLNSWLSKINVVLSTIVDRFVCQFSSTAAIVALLDLCSFKPHSNVFSSSQEFSCQNKSKHFSLSHNNICHDLCHAGTLSKRSEETIPLAAHTFCSSYIHINLTNPKMPKRNLNGLTNLWHVLQSPLGKAIPIKCFVSHHQTDPFFWKRKKRIQNHL